MNDIVATFEGISRNHGREDCIEDAPIPKPRGNIIRKQVVDFMTKRRQRSSEPEDEFWRAQTWISWMGSG